MLTPEEGDKTGSCPQETDQYPEVLSHQKARKGIYPAEPQGKGTYLWVSIQALKTRHTATVKSPLVFYLGLLLL